MDTLNNLYRDFLDGINAIIQWLDYLLYIILNLHVYFFNWLWLMFAEFSTWLANLFPSPGDDLTGIHVDSGTLLTLMAEYLMVINYFVNLPILGMALAFALAVSAVCTVISLIKTVWAVIPVA